MVDKIDTWSGFSRSMKPTGSKDLLALRRAALGLIRLITEITCACRWPSYSRRRRRATRIYGDGALADLTPFPADLLKASRGAVSATT